MVLDFLTSAVELLRDFNTKNSRFRHFKANTILLATDSDEDAYHHMEIHRDRFPNALEHTFTEPGGNHFIFLQPEIYTRKLTEFLLKTQ